MTDAHENEILVGFSRSSASAAALRWAVAEAKRRKVRVRVLHVYDEDEHADAALEKRSASAPDQRTDLSGRVLDVLGDDAEGVPVTVAHRAGTLVDTLGAAAAHAQMLVIGRPGECRHRGIDERLRLKVACPVMVVGAP
jgi:nucleotide-binding universal stress UspA family protein